MFALVAVTAEGVLLVENALHAHPHFGAEQVERLVIYAHLVGSGRPLVGVVDEHFALPEAASFRGEDVGGTAVNPFRLAVGVNPGFGVRVAVVVKGDYVNAVEHGEQGRPVVDERGVNLRLAVGQNMHHRA